MKVKKEIPMVLNYTPPPHILPLKGGGKRWG